MVLDESQPLGCHTHVGSSLGLRSHTQLTLYLVIAFAATHTASEWLLEALFSKCVKILFTNSSVCHISPYAPSDPSVPHVTSPVFRLVLVRPRYFLPMSESLHPIPLMGRSARPSARFWRLNQGVGYVTSQQLIVPSYCTTVPEQPIVIRECAYAVSSGE